MASGKKLLILFDELFEGKNVKDAYDGTLSITASIPVQDNFVLPVSNHWQIRCKKRVIYVYYALNVNKRITVFLLYLYLGWCNRNIAIATPFSNFLNLNQAWRRAVLSADNKSISHRTSYYSLTALFGQIAKGRGSIVVGEKSDTSFNCKTS